MKTGLLLGLAAALISLNAIGAEPAGLKTEKQKFSYTVGQQVGQNLKRQNLDVDPRTVAQGIQDALSGAQPRLKPEEMQAAIQAYQKKDLAKR